MASKKTKSTEPTFDEVSKRVRKAKQLLEEIVALFPEAQMLPGGDRRLSQGRLGADESAAMRGVVAAMEAEPAVFASLADRDGGAEPTKLETALMRDRLDRHDAYLELAGDVESIARLFGDQALTLGALVAPPLRAGYEIAKPVSKTNAHIRGKIADMLDYHGANAKAALASRKAHRATKKPVPA